MVEHWYDYLPAAWFVADGPLTVAAAAALLLAAGFVAGWLARGAKK